MRAIVTMTSRGVVTLPAKLRKALGLKAGDALIAEVTEGESACIPRWKADDPLGHGV